MPDRRNILKIGIMCRGYNFPAWQAETIKNLMEVPGVEISLLIGEKHHFPENDVSNQSSLDNSIKQTALAYYRRFKFWFLTTKFFPKKFLWIWYSRITNILNQPSCDKPVDLSKNLKSAAILICNPETKNRYSQYFSKSEIQNIESYNLDVILRFGFNIIRGDVLQSAKYGIWSFHHGDYQKYRGGPPGFWEILNGDQFSGIILQQLTDKLDDGIVLYEGKITTIQYSYTANRNQLFWHGTGWPAAICRNLLDGKTDSLFIKTDPSSAPIKKAPANSQFTNYILISILGKINRIVSRLRQPEPKQETWAIGVIKNSDFELLNYNKPISAKWLPLPNGMFQADPFIIEHNKSYYIFFEEFDYSTKLGHISFIQTSDFEKFTAHKTAIKMPFHLSYPFMLKADEKIYCIPEQYQSGEVAIYEALSFPDQWVKRAVLLPNFAGVDTTVFRANGSWWMFTANFNNNDQGKLFLFMADDLFGPWKAHPDNPVVEKNRLTRPAGPVFKITDELIRPTQNCTKTYGGSIIFNKITELSTESYAEQYWGEIKPNPEGEYPDGLHHIASIDGFTLIDGKKMNPVEKKN